MFENMPIVTFFSLFLKVLRNLYGDLLRDMTPDLSAILNKNIPVLVCSGDRDLVCHWLGTQVRLPELL